MTPCGQTAVLNLVSTNVRMILEVTVGLTHLLHVVLEHHGLGHVLELQAQGHLVERRLILGATLELGMGRFLFEASAPKFFSSGRWPLIVKIPFSYRPDMTLAAEVRVSTRELNVFARKS